MRKLYAFLTAASAVLLCASCQPSSSDKAGGDQSSHQPRQQDSVLLLTASNHLQALAISSGRMLWRTGLGGDLQSHFTVHAIGLTLDRKHAVVLVRGATSSIVLVDVATGSVSRRQQLAAGLAYRGLAVGAVTGRIYVFSNRDVGPDRGPTHGPPSSAVVTVLAPDLSTVIYSQTVRDSDGFDWFVYEGATDSSETHMLVSYHGPDTTGIDLLSIEANRLADPCGGLGTGCIQSHGGFIITTSRLYLATGASPILETTPTGVIVGQIDTGIQNEHIMELALDASGKSIFIAGSCLYSGGLFRVDLQSQHTLALASQGSNICGERVVDSDNAIAVVIDPDVLLVSLPSGRLTRRFDGTNDPYVDGVALR